MDLEFSIPEISVIIPTYNRASFLPAAIESVISQRIDNIEIIIIDDGSTDNTNSVIDYLSEKIPNIHLYNNERSKGPSGARNTGILKSSGEFLAFLDSDDVYLENHLATGLEMMKRHPEIDVIFSNFRVVDFKTGARLYNFFDKKTTLFKLKSKIIDSDLFLLQDNLFEALLQEIFFHFGSSFIRKSIIKHILLDESVMFAEDMDFAIRLFKETDARFSYRKNPYFVQHMHDTHLYAGNDFRTHINVVRDKISLYKKYINTYTLSNGEKRILNKRISQSLARLSILYARDKNISHAFYVGIESFKHGFSFYQINKLLVMISYLFRNFTIIKARPKKRH